MKKALFVLLLAPFFCLGQVQNFDYYSVGYSEIGTEWCTYRLTKEMVEGDTTRRRQSFRAFNGFVTSDYTNTGFDRGHLCPADAMSFDKDAYSSTYSLANIAPMNPKMNRQVWRFIENYERRLTLVHDCIIITITVHYGEKKVGKLTIPEYFIKKINNCSGEVITEFKLENI